MPVSMKVKRLMYRRDYATAYKEFKPLAEQGEVEAQLQSAEIYKGVPGVPQNYS